MLDVIKKHKEWTPVEVYRRLFRQKTANNDDANEDEEIDPKIVEEIGNLLDNFGRYDDDDDDDDDSPPGARAAESSSSSAVGESDASFVSDAASADAVFVDDSATEDAAADAAGAAAVTEATKSSAHCGLEQTRIET